MNNGLIEGENAGTATGGSDEGTANSSGGMNNTQNNTENIIINTDKNSDSDPKENTRTYIAQLYVWAFFIVIGVVFLIGLIKCFSVDEYKDMLVTVSGVLSGPLGFIVGYYFKAAQR